MKAKRFLNESRIAAALEHPGIPAVYDTGRLPDGRPFYAMQIVREENNLYAELLERTDSTQDLERYLGIFERVAKRSLTRTPAA